MRYPNGCHAAGANNFKIILTANGCSVVPQPRTHAFFSHGSFVNIAQFMAPYTVIGIGLVLLAVVVGGTGSTCAASARTST
jgi:hypothetical protein